LVQTSQVATLTVTADTKPPTIASVSQLNDTFTKLTVNFSEPVTSPSATTAGNYTLNGGATVSAATLSADRFSVTLTTSKLTQNTPYTLTVSNVKDNAGNSIVANSTANFTSWTLVAGTVKVDQWNGISGTAVSALTADPRFPATPDVEFFVNTGLLVGSPNGNAGFNNSYGDNYGIMVTGLLVPKTSGTYDFFIRSDDASELHLNTSGASLPDPITSTPLVQETGCCHAFLEPTDPGNTGMTTTTPVSLTGGSQYGVIVLLKEGGGGDGVAVGMRKTGDTTAAGALPQITDQIFWYGTAVASTAPNLTISRSGSNITLTWSSGTLQSAGTLKATGTTWTPVAGANSPYTTAIGSTPLFFRTQ
jgi:hypothetical protein